ncbi:MAG: hypothetical protein AB1894_13175 [Chloroflexota bacterium]
MQNSTALPDLRMLPSAQLVPHEDVDPRRVENLSKRLLEESILKNPPVVAQVPDMERFVVLDGANRTMAFQRVRIPHIVAQVVSYNDPGVTLETWHHVVSGMPAETFEGALANLQGLELHACQQDEARQAVESGEAAAYMINDGGARALVWQPGQQHSMLNGLRLIVGTYRGKADIIRASNDIWEIQKPCYPEITALVVFSRLKPEDILQAGRNGEKVPSGITRHVVPTRALNINIPIGILMADMPLERKCQWLKDWWAERLTANAVRYYAEPTFSFNE